MGSHLPTNYASTHKALLEERADLDNKEKKL